MRYVWTRPHAADRLPEAHQLFTRGQRLRLPGEHEPVLIEHAERVGTGWTLDVSDRYGTRHMILNDADAAGIEVLSSDLAPPNGSRPGRDPDGRLWRRRLRSGGRTTASVRWRRRGLLVTAPIVAALVGAIAVFLVLRNSSGTVVIRDDFAGIRPSLNGSHPNAAAAETWRVSSGAVGAADGAAFAPATSIVSIAAIHGAETLTSLHVEISPVGDGSGIVFRYVDAQNYWSLTAASSYGTWNISRVVRGAAQFVGNTGLSFNRAGSAVDIKLTDQLIKIAIDGVPRQIVVDTALNTGSGAGLLAAPNDAGATRWHHFRLTQRR